MIRRWQLALLVVSLAVLASVPVFAGSAVVGSLAGAVNATIGGEKVIPGGTIFSGDSLRVENGAAVVTLGDGSRLVLGRDTAATFQRQANEITALVSQGDVSLFHAENDPLSLALKVGNLLIEPAAGLRTLGEVAMTDRALTISTTEGLLRVEANGKTVEIGKGKWLKFPAKKSKAPQQAGGAQHYGTNYDTILDAAAVGGAAVAAILAGVAMSRSGDARTAANQADADAKAATSAAEAATSAANTADADAVAATSAANAANANATAVGCALDVLAGELGKPSPFKPSTGTC